MDTQPPFIERILHALDEIRDLLVRVLDLVVGQRDDSVPSLSAAAADSDATVTIQEHLITLADEVRAYGRRVEADCAGVREELSRLQSLVLMGRKKYSRDEAAKRLGVSVKTLDRRLRDGLIVGSQEGGRVFVTEQAIRDYEDAQRRAN